MLLGFYLGDFMSIITGNPNDPVFQVRLYIGDTDSVLVADEIIEYALVNNSDNVKSASIETLKYILAFLAQETSHQVGDVLADYNKLYDQASRQLDRLIKDPSFNPTLGFFVGGTSKAEKERVTGNTDFIGSPFKSGEALS